MTILGGQHSLCFAAPPTSCPMLMKIHPHEKSVHMLPESCKTIGFSNSTYKLMFLPLLPPPPQVTPNDPKLWCALGDIQRDDSAYLKAWEVSGHRSARAQRSLARSAVEKKEWGAAAEHWGLALGLSPMYPEAWFSLGYCYLKLGQSKKALQVQAGRCRWGMGGREGRGGRGARGAREWKGG